MHKEGARVPVRVLARMEDVAMLAQVLMHRRMKNSADSTTLMTGPVSVMPSAGDQPNLRVPGLGLGVCWHVYMDACMFVS